MLVKKSLRLLCYFVVSLCLLACANDVGEGRMNRKYVQVKDLELVNQSVDVQEDNEFSIYTVQIKNNSKHVIKGITIDVMLDNGRHTTIVTQDTLRPNDVSSWIRCVGPSSGELKDLKATRYTIRSIDDEMKQTIVTYDVQSSQYTYHEVDEWSDKQPLVKVDEIEFVNPVFRGMDDEDFMFQTYLKNKSPYELKGITYTFEDCEGYNYVLSHPLTIGQGEMTSLLTMSFLPSELLEDYQLKSVRYYYLDESNELVDVNYDVRLDYYFVS